MTLAGETIAVATLLAAQVRPFARRDIAHARELLQPDSQKPIRDWQTPTRSYWFL